MVSRIFGLLVIVLFVFSLVGAGVVSVEAHGDEDISDPDHHDEMMGNSFWGSGMAGGFGFMWVFGWLFMVLIIVALVLLIIWLIKQLQRDERRK